MSSECEWEGECEGECECECAYELSITIPRYLVTKGSKMMLDFNIGGMSHIACCACTKYVAIDYQGLCVLNTVVVTPHSIHTDLPG